MNFVCAAEQQTYEHDLAWHKRRSDNANMLMTWESSNQKKRASNVYAEQLGVAE